MWTDGCTKESKARVSQRQKPKLDRWTTNIITRTESAGDRKPDVDRRPGQRQRTKDGKTDHTDRQTDENKVSQRQKQSQSETENPRWTASEATQTDKLTRTNSVRDREPKVDRQAAQTGKLRRTKSIREKRTKYGQTVHTD